MREGGRRRGRERELVTDMQYTTDHVKEEEESCVRVTSQEHCQPHTVWEEGGEGKEGRRRQDVSYPCLK